MAASKALKRSAEETATTSKGQSGSPKKKQCRKRTCLVCDTKKHYTQFPSQTKVSSHDHGANVCRPCYFSHLEVEIDSKNWDEVACPECPTKLTYQEVESMTNAENFAKYERASIRATLAADPDFRFCFSSACESGQLHPGGASEPIFSCQVCRHKHCVVCETNWHEDQTCEEFQAELHRNTENDEKSEKEVEKISKPCPECRVPIQKNKDCDHMTCSRCRHQFCWICSASYTDIVGEGNHRHEKSCTHYRAAPSAEALEAQRRRTEEAREAQRRRTEEALEAQRRRDEEARQRREEAIRRQREIQEQARQQLQADQQARTPNAPPTATPAPTSGLAPASVHIEGARDTSLSEHVLARLAHRAPTTAAAPQPTQNEEGDRRTAPTPTPP